MVNVSGKLTLSLGKIGLNYHIPSIFSSSLLWFQVD